MSDETARLKLAQLVSLQELNAVTWNEALAQLDALVDLCLSGQFLNTPPENPADGDAYLIGGAPSGAWTGYAYKIASCLDGAWRFATPFNGMRAFVVPAGSVIVYRNGQWLNIASTDFATKSGAETLTNKTLGATLLPGGGIINADGHLGLQVANPGEFLAVLSPNSNTVASFTANVAQSGASGGIIKLYENDGAGIVAGTRLGGFLFGGPRTSGGAPVNALGAFGWSEENWGTGNNGSCLTFETTASGGTTRSERLRITGDGTVQPGTDNTQSLGSAAKRWSVVFAGTGTINTSGAAEKVNIRQLSEAERAVAMELAGYVNVYQFHDAAERKGGDGARLHVGLVAESVLDTFRRHGLDAFRYGICCRDPAVKTVTKTTEDGEEIAISEPVLDANGSTQWVLGLRYDELAQFMVAGLCARLAALEGWV